MSDNEDTYHASLTSNDPEWDKIVESFVREYSVFKFGSNRGASGLLQKLPKSALGTPADSHQMPLQSLLSPESQVLDRLIDIDERLSSATGVFQKHNFDLHLLQIGSLVEALISGRDELLEVMRRGSNLLLEFLEFQELDGITSDEVKSGKFQLEEKRSKHLLEVANARKSTKDYVAARYESYASQNLSAQAKNSRIDLAATIAEYSHYPALRPVDPIMSFVQEKGATSIVVRDASRDAATFSLSDLEHTVLVAKSEAAAEKIIANSESTFASTQADWDQANVAFQERRVKVSRDMIRLRIGLAQEPGGPFNYGAARHRVVARMASDLAQLLRRIRVTRDGLRDYLGLDLVIPGSLSGIFSDTPTWRSLKNGFLDELEEWVRSAQFAMLEANNRQQVISFTHSLFKLMGSSKWQDFIDGRQVDFLFPIESLQTRQDLRAPRLRSISAFTLERSTSMSSIAVDVVPPARAQTRSNDAIWSPIEQKVAKVTIGGVRSRTDLYRAESLSSPLLTNLSPYGVWTIQIHGSVARPGLTDIELDFEIAFLTA